MKKLLIMRHAKTEEHKMFGSDFVRNLTPNGRNQAGIQGKFLSLLPFVPTTIFVSPSNRTQQTLEELFPLTQWTKPNIVTIDKLYHSSLADLLEVVTEMDNKEDSIMVVGHNFGVLELVQHFSNEFIEKFKTGSMALFHFNAKSWKELSVENGKCIYLKEPLDD